MNGDATPDRHGPLAGLATLLRAALLLRFDTTRQPGSPWAVLVLAALAAAVWFAVDFVLNRPGADFYVHGLVDYAYVALGAVVVAFTLYVATARRVALAWAGMLVALAAPTLAVAWQGALRVGDWASAGSQPSTTALVALIAPCVYTALLWLRGLRGLPWRPRLAGWAWALVCLFGVGASAEALGVAPSMWIAREPQDDGRDDEIWARAESLMFAQQERIDAAIAKLPPGRPGPARVFFVGFAGYGDQRLFANEIRLAQRVVERRFGLDGRAVVLANDRDDLERAPLASVSALRYALRHVARHMNIDKDVLFLALSSHGGADASLAVVNGPLPFEDLYAHELADALAASGIKWKVIVISACHAGAFIPALKDPHTIVLAAAAPDRTSFGCADHRALSYFGEAFYRDALPRAATLAAAFDSATRAIAARERAENITPSLPRAYYGAAMAARIDALTKPVR